MTCKEWAQVRTYRNRLAREGYRVDCIFGRKDKLVIRVRQRRYFTFALPSQ